MSGIVDSFCEEAAFSILVVTLASPRSVSTLQTSTTRSLADFKTLTMQAR